LTEDEERYKKKAGILVRWAITTVEELVGIAHMIVDNRIQISYLEHKAKSGYSKKKKQISPEEINPGEILAGGACPQCGRGPFVREGGCSICRACGYSECG